MFNNIYQFFKKFCRVTYLSKNDFPKSNYLQYIDTYKNIIKSDKLSNRNRTTFNFFLETQIGKTILHETLSNLIKDNKNISYPELYSKVKESKTLVDEDIEDLYYYAVNNGYIHVLDIPPKILDYKYFALVKTQQLHPLLKELTRDSKYIYIMTKIV